MAIQAPYKKYIRGQRQANVETDFTSGMMFSEGAVSDGYVKTLVNFDFTEEELSSSIGRNRKIIGLNNDKMYAAIEKLLEVNE